MDHRLQVTHHSASHDTRRGTQRDAEVRSGVAFEACHKQFLRWYVQGVSYGICTGTDRMWVYMFVKRSGLSLMRALPLEIVLMDVGG